jgi:hypothetical protein
MNEKPKPFIVRGLGCFYRLKTHCMKYSNLIVLIGKKERLVLP